MVLASFSHWHTTLWSFSLYHSSFCLYLCWQTNCSWPHSLPVYVHEKKNYFIGKILKNPKPQTPKLCTLNTNYSSLQDHTSWPFLFYFLSTLKYQYCQKFFPENTTNHEKMTSKFCLSFWERVLLGFWGGTGTCYVAQAGHELTFFLSQPLASWGYMDASLLSRVYQSPLNIRQYWQNHRGCTKCQILEHW